MIRILNFLLVSALILLVASKSLSSTLKPENYFKAQSDNQHSLLLRVKRQYFKPTMDGDWINISSTDQQNGIKQLKATNFRRSSINNQTIGDTNQPLTVTSLGLSLITLFDKLKLTICDMIQYECKNTIKY